MNTTTSPNRSGSTCRASGRQLLTLLVGLLAAGCGRQPAATPVRAQSAAPRPTVQVAAVQVGPIQQTLPLTGVLHALPNQQVTINPPVTGALDQLPIRYSETVLRGQVVAHLSTRQLQGQIAQAKATLAQDEVKVRQARANVLQQQAQTRTAIEQAQAAYAGAEAMLDQAEVTLTGKQAALQNARENLTRVQTLFKEGLLAQKDVQAAQLAVQTAVADVNAQQQAIDAQRQTVESQRHAIQAARAAAVQDVVKQQDVQVARQQVLNSQGALATVRAQLALYTLHAPIHGQVTAVGASVGQTVDPTTKLATITNLDRLQLQIGVPSQSAREVLPGQRVSFRVANLPGEVFQSSIQTVGTQVDPTTNTVPALAVIANPGHRLKDNSVVRVQIVVQRHPSALLVPQQALLTDPVSHATSVTVIGSDEVAHVIPVSVGLKTSSQAEITHGLKPGARVAVSGQYGLPDGTKVSVQNAT